MPSNLAATQRWLWGQLQPGARRAGGLVRGRGGLSATARVAVYADGYLARLVEALQAEFPRLHRALGDARFWKLTQAYVARHPSTRPTIQHLGHELPQYLARHPVRGVPEAMDLARCDQTASEVYLSEGLGEGALLATDDLRRLSPAAWPKLQLRFVSSLRVIRLTHGATWIRFWRKGLDVREAELAPGEKRALDVARRGAPFEEVCLAAGTAERAATLLATWVEDGLIEGLATTRKGPLWRG